MDLQLQGRCALVTGSTSGTGAAIARSLAAEGVRTIVHGRDRDKADRVVNEIHNAGGEAMCIVGDLSHDPAVELIAAKAISAFGGVDILVNNGAMIGSYEQWDDLDATAWSGMYDGVVLVVVRMVNALRQHMASRGWGRIINISSAQGVQQFAMMPHYASSKSAVISLTKSLSKQLDRSGTTVNVVSPGIIVTERVRLRLTSAAQEAGRGTSWEDVEEWVLRNEFDNPTGRLARPEDVADLVTFLASPKAGYINGANIPLEGGSLQSIW